MAAAALGDGGGRKFSILETAEGTDGSTLTCPPLEIASRPVPSEFPVVGSNTMPAWAGTLAPSVVVTINGLAQPLEDVLPSVQMKSPSRPRKSPPRSAAVGTVVTTEAARRRRVP